MATAASVMSTEDMWEGSAKYFSFASRFQKFLAKSAVANGVESCVVEFVFPPHVAAKLGGRKSQRSATSPAVLFRSVLLLMTHRRSWVFSVTEKSFKVSVQNQICQILSLVCSRLQLTNSQSFEITTLRGFPLSKDRNLGSYGLGALFKRWILKLDLPEVPCGTDPVRIPMISYSPAIVCPLSFKLLLVSSSRIVGLRQVADTAMVESLLHDHIDHAWTVIMRRRDAQKKLEEEQMRSQWKKMERNYMLEARFVTLPRHAQSKVLAFMMQVNGGPQLCTWLTASASQRLADSCLRRCRSSGRRLRSPGRRRSRSRSAESGGSSCSQTSSAASPSSRRSSSSG